jgi:hypothetical protein
MDVIEDAQGGVQLRWVGDWIKAEQLAEELLIGPGFVLQ